MNTKTAFYTKSQVKHPTLVELWSPLPLLLHLVEPESSLETASSLLESRSPLFHCPQVAQIGSVGCLVPVPVLFGCLCVLQSRWWFLLHWHCHLFVVHSLIARLLQASLPIKMACYWWKWFDAFHNETDVWGGIYIHTLHFFINPAIFCTIIINQCFSFFMISKKCIYAIYISGPEQGWTPPPTPPCLGQHPPAMCEGYIYIYICICTITPCPRYTP